MDTCPACRGVIPDGRTSCPACGRPAPTGRTSRTDLYRELRAGLVVDPDAGADTSAATRDVTATAPVPAPSPAPTPSLTPEGAAILAARAAGPAPFDWLSAVVGGPGRRGGSLLVALGTLVVTGLVSLGTVLAARSPGFGNAATWHLVASQTCAAFGVRYDVHGTVGAASYDQRVSAVPLTLTAVMLGTLVLLFGRLLKRHTSAFEALTDALRVAVLLGLGLLVVATSTRTDLGSYTALSKEVEAELGSSSLTVSMSPGQSVLLGIVVPLLVCGLMVLGRRAWWPTAGVGRLLDAIVAPLYGYLALFLMLPFAGLAGFLLLANGQSSVTSHEDTTPLHTILAVVFSALGNGGVFVLGLGGGSTVGVRTDVHTSAGDGITAPVAPSQDFHTSHYERLWPHITNVEPGLWGCPVVLVIVLTIAVAVVIRKATSHAAAFGNLVVFVAGMLAVAPLLARLAGLRPPSTSRPPPSRPTHRRPWGCGSPPRSSC